RRSRLLGDINGTIDLDEVLRRALEAAAAIPGVDAALIRVDAPDGTPTIATLGIPDEEAVRHSAAVPPGERDLRAVELSYRYAETAARMREVARTADVPCRVGGDEFAVIMPESTLEDAEQLFQRIQTVISSRAIGQAGRLRLSAGLAELRPDDDSVSLFERAD